MATSNKRPSDHASEPPLKKPRFIDGMRRRCARSATTSRVRTVADHADSVWSYLDQLVNAWGQGKCPLTNQEFHREEVVESIGLKHVTVDYVTWETEQRRRETLRRLP